MEVGKERLTDEDLYCRIIRLIHECGTLTLKELLIKVVRDLTSGKDKDLDKFLFSWKHVLYPCIQNYEHGRKRCRILFPGQNEKTDLAEWDLSLCALVILKTCNLDKHLQGDVKRLREIRNKMCHIGSTAITRDEYQIYAVDIKCSVENICKFIGNVEFHSKVDEKFQSIQILNVTYEKKGKSSELDQGLAEEDGDAVVNLEQLAATNVIQEHTRSQILRLTLNNCPEDKYRELVSKFQEALQEEKDCASHSAKQADEHFLNVSAPSTSTSSSEHDDPLKRAFLSFLRTLSECDCNVDKVEEGSIILTVNCLTTKAFISLCNMCITGQIYMVIYPLEEEIRQIYGIKYLDVKITAQKQSFVKNVADITRQVASLKREQGATLSCPVKVKLSKTTMETYFDESAKNKLQIEAEVKLPIYIDPGSVSRNVSKNKHRVCNEFAEVCRKELNISTLDVQFDLSPSKEINAERLSATAEVQPLSEKSSRKAQHIRDIQIKEREERFPCVTGILVIHDKMFLVDSADKRDGNQTIKVVDLKTDTIAYALKLDDIPWDLTSVGEEKIAVTFPMKGDVGFYLHSSENPLLFESNIDVGEGCRGIVYANKTLLVSFAATSSERRGRVEVLSLFGEHLKIFENTENDHMYYISQEDEQEYFFVSDFENNHIITMNDNGKILCEYYDVEMPYGIVSDSSGSLFACSSCCKTAVELNLSTGQAHELIKKQYLRQPRCVAFCKETKLMYIGMWKNNFVKVFRLS